MIQLFENFIPEQYQERLEKTFLNPNHQWCYRMNTLGSKDDIQGYVGYYDEQFEDTDYLVNPIHNGFEVLSPLFTLIKPMIYFFEDKTNLKVLDIVRIKANLLMPAGFNRLHPPHVDYTSKNSYSLLYYVNDCDGETTFYEERYTGKVQEKMTKVCSYTPKKGTAVVFPSTQFHSGSCSKTDLRCAINMIFSVEI